MGLSPLTCGLFDSWPCWFRPAGQRYMQFVHASRANEVILFRCNRVFLASLDIFFVRQPVTRQHGSTFHYHATPPPLVRNPASAVVIYHPYTHLSRANEVISFRGNRISSTSHDTSLVRQSVTRHNGSTFHDHTTPTSIVQIHGTSENSRPLQ